MATLVVVAILTSAAIGGVLALSSQAGSAARATITVTRTATGRPIPSAFVGLSIEYTDLEAYAGKDSRVVNPVFEHLIGNLAPGQSLSLRIGGDSTDWTWWPIGGKHRPLGLRYTLTPRWLRVARALSSATNAQLILGINLEANSRRIAATEAHALVRGLGAKSIQGLEIGNEPELYPSFAWYVLNGTKYYGRPTGYTFGDFIGDFSRVTKVMPHVPIAGPDIGGPSWMPYLRRFLTGESSVKVATLHRYPLKHCRSVAHNTIDDLLSNASSRGLANSVAHYAVVAHQHHVPLRLDEINAVSCGGEPGVSDTFASALWSVDALFQMARVGVDGVNFHTRPGSSGELFTVTRSHHGWRASVHPEYYGLMMFAQAAPPGSRLLRIAGSPGGSMSAWATRGTDRHIRVVLINKSTDNARTISVRIPGAAGAGTLERLAAPNAHSKGHVSLGGHSFGSSTTTGTLPGTATGKPISPAGARYVITLPAASAALLTVPGA